MAGCTGAGGKYTYITSNGVQVYKPSHPRADSKGWTFHYISRYEALGKYNRKVSGKPALFGLRLTREEKDIMPPVYTSLRLIGSNTAIGQRQNSATWERFDIPSKTFSPLPFEQVISAVGSYSGKKYSGQRMNEVQHLIGITERADGRYTAWFFDNQGNITATIDNVADLPIHKQFTKAQDAYGEPQPIHYFGNGRYFVHHQDAVNGEIYGQFHDQNGKATSPRMPQLVWHFGGPVTFDAEEQADLITTIPTIVIDPERNLHWPLQANGRVSTMPENALGMTPIANPLDNHTFGWMVLWEHDGKQAWSLLSNFTDARKPLNTMSKGVEISEAKYSGFTVVMETHNQGTQLRALPTALLELRHANYKPSGFSKAFRYQRREYGVSRGDNLTERMIANLEQHSIDAKLRAEQIAEAERAMRRAAELAREEQRRKAREHMLELMAQGKWSEAEAIAMQQGPYAMSMLANHYPRQISTDLMYKVWQNAPAGASKARWASLLAARMPPPPVQQSQPTFTLVSPRYRMATGPNGAGDKIGAIYDQARYKSKMNYLRGNTNWYLD